MRPVQLAFQVVMVMGAVFVRFTVFVRMGVRGAILWLCFR